MIIRAMFTIMLVGISISANAMYAKCYSPDGKHVVYQGYAKDVAYTEDFFVFRDDKKNLIYVFGDCMFKTKEKLCKKHKPQKH